MPTEIRLLQGADLPALDRFLKSQPCGISLRGFLALEGVTPGHGVYAGVLEEGEVTSVLAFLGGTIYLVAPRKLESLLALAGRSRGERIVGFIGPAAQVERALGWLDARDAPTLMHTRDELFVLPLANLKEPPLPGSSELRCRPANAQDAALLGAWRHDFWVENLGARPGEKLLETCQKLVDDEIAKGVLYLLEDGGRPVSTAAFAPALADAVQVANVYTPPALRGRKYAQAITAGMLLGARARGVEVGILFTGFENAPAQRAYRALGFQPCGAYTTLAFTEPRLATPGG